MLHDHRVAVVVPARNEARFIAATVRTVPAWVDLVVVVDDGSTDDTSALARGAGREGVEILRHEASRGVGAAIVAGYRRALARGADVVAVMAGDGQMHPDDLERVVSPVALGGCDYAKGNRLDHPDVRGTMPIQRLVAGEVLSRLTGLATGHPLRDSQSGFTAISRAALERIDLSATWPGYGYPNDLFAALVREGLRPADVVVRPVYRGEASGLRPWHLGTIGFLLGRAFVRRVAPRVLRPLSASPLARRRPTSPGDDRDRPTAGGTPRARAPGAPPPQERRGSAVAAP